MAKRIKNNELIKALENFKPDIPVTLDANFERKSVYEEGYGRGSWEGHDFTFEYTTYWRTAKLENKDNEYSVQDIINIFSKKWMNELSHKDLRLNLTETTDGSTDISVEWNGDFSDEELDTRPSDMDCYWNGEINDSEYKFDGGLDTLEIKVDLGYGNYWSIILDGSEQEKQEAREKQIEKENLAEKKRKEKEKIKKQKEREKAKAIKLKKASKK